ncbi:MAG: four helix bundle protein [Candidatus ainarchaeum sp.]|nr:four helix bundle protein [Candidatus ainarchaeum sp.]
MQTFDQLMVYEEAFRLTEDIFRFMQDRKVSHRANHELLASASYLSASLAEMGAIDSVDAQREMLLCCIGEANETEFWLGTCRSLGLISQREHLGCMDALMHIKSMLCGLQAAVEAGN